MDEDDERAIVNIFGFLQHRGDRFNSASSSTHQWSTHPDRSLSSKNMSYYNEHNHFQRYGDG